MTERAEDFHARRHDEIVRGMRDQGINVKELNDILIEDLTAAIADGVVDPVGVEAYVRSRTDSLRDARNSLLDDRLPDILDALSGATLLEDDDPIRDIAVPVSGKARKTFRWCDWEDLESMKRARMGNAVAALSKAHQFATGIEKVQDEMKQRGARVVDDVI